jgi:hypothetical protein
MEHHKENVHQEEETVVTIAKKKELDIKERENNSQLFPDSYLSANCRAMSLNTGVLPLPQASGNRFCTQTCMPITKSPSAACTKIFHQNYITDDTSLETLSSLS